MVRLVECFSHVKIWNDGSNIIFKAISQLPLAAWLMYVFCGGFVSTTRLRLIEHSPYRLQTPLTSTMCSTFPFTLTLPSLYTRTGGQQRTAAIICRRLSSCCVRVLGKDPASGVYRPLSTEAVYRRGGPVPPPVTPGRRPARPRPFPTLPPLIVPPPPVGWPRRSRRGGDGRGAPGEQVGDAQLMVSAEIPVE